MKGVPTAARACVLFLALGAATIVAYSLSLIRDDTDLWLRVLFAALAIAALDTIPIRIFGGHVETTISDSVKFAAVLLFPFPVPVLGSFLGTLIGELVAERALVKKIFNVAELTITLALVKWIYLGIHQPEVDYFGSIQNVLALTTAGVAAFAVNSFLVTLVVSLAMRLPFRYVWSQNSSQVMWHDLSMIPLGAFLAVLWRFNPLSVVLAALPLFVVRHAFEVANELQRQTHDALRMLVRVIDERDHHTLDHSERVSNYANEIAGALNRPQEECDVIATAALLHDLGKVGMVDEILFNPNVLNPEERKKAQAHAQVGADLLSRFPLFRKGADLVRHHHERYDGKGYPDGLKGEEIPIGARIISVADAYQAMTEERPYRRALSRDEAVQQLLQGSGSQFDPKVVQAFLKILPALTSAQAQKVSATTRIAAAEA